MKIVAYDERVEKIDAIFAAITAMDCDGLIVRGITPNRTLLIVAACRKCGIEPFVLFAPFRICDISSRVMMRLHDARVEFRIVGIESPVFFITSSLSRREDKKWRRTQTQVVAKEMRDMVEDMYARITGFEILGNVLKDYDDEMVVQLLEHLEVRSV